MRPRMTPEQWVTADISETEDSAFARASKRIIQRFDAALFEQWCDGVSAESFRALPNGVPTFLVQHVIGRKLCDDQRATHLIQALGHGVRSRKLVALCAEQGLAQAADAAGGVGLLLEDSGASAGGTLLSTLTREDAVGLARLYPRVSTRALEPLEPALAAVYGSTLLRAPESEHLRSSAAFVMWTLTAICRLRQTQSDVAEEQFEFHAFLAEVIEHPRQFAYDAERLENLLEDARLYRALAVLCVTQGRLKRGVEVARRTDSVELLLLVLQRCRAVSDWQQAIAQCASSPTLLDALVAQLNTLAGGHALDLVLQDPIAAATVHPRLCIEAIQATESNGHAVRARRALLEAADTQLWAHKVAPVPPARSLREGSERLAGEFWGADVQAMKSTCICGLPLFASFGASLTVFECGHAFHLRCTTDAVCSKCVAKSFRLL